MRDRPMRSAPDYTLAALVMLGVNLTWVFFLLWAVWGLLPVVLLAIFMNHLIGRLACR